MDTFLATLSDELREEASEARNLSICQGTFDKTSAFVKQYMDHSTVLEVAYKTIQELRLKKSSHSDYVPVVAGLTETRAWYEAHAPAGRAMRDSMGMNDALVAKEEKKRKKQEEKDAKKDKEKKPKARGTIYCIHPPRKCRDNATARKIIKFTFWGCVSRFL